jgi:hypothetical protein
VPVLDETASERLFVTAAGNPFGLPAKDRSGRLYVTEPADLGRLLTRSISLNPKGGPHEL